MLFNFSSASIPIRHLIWLFFVWKRTLVLWWLFCWISLLIFPADFMASVARLLFTVSSILLALSFISLTQVGDDCCGFQWRIFHDFPIHGGTLGEHGEGQELDDVICG